MTVLTRKAALVMGAVQGFLVPKLAQDAKIDLTPLFGDVTVKNYKDRRDKLVVGIAAATQGKLAQDAKLDDLSKVLMAFDAAEPEEGETEEEKKAREAKDKKAKDAKAAADKKARDAKMGKDARKRGMDALPDEVREKMKASMDEAAYKAACDAMSDYDPGAMDAAEEEKKKSEDAKRARDAEEEKEKEKAEDKKAMDAAIGAAVGMERKRQAELNEALRAVRPLVGELAIAFDSAEDVFKKVLEMKGAKIVGVHPSAYRALIDMLPKVSGTRPEPRLAMDAAHADLAKKYAPSINSIRVGT